MDLAFINVVSTKRSGHHAFIAWMMQHAPWRCVFVNNAVIGCDLTTAVQTAIAKAQMADAAMRTGDEPLRVIMNFEGVTPQGVADTIAAQRGLSDDIKTVVFLRDPLNVVASLINRKNVPVKDLAMLIRQVAAERTLLSAVRDGQDKGAAEDVRITAAVTADTVVFYNPWLTDAAHRGEVARDLGLTASDMVDAVSQYGGGSSFDAADTYGADDAARLLSRWQAQRDWPIFRALVAHPAVSEIFAAALTGAIADSFGGTFADDAGAAALAEFADKPSGHMTADRFMARLAPGHPVFAEIERAGSAAKKPLVLKASLLGLFGRAAA